ncbi:hypothetical protein BO86DRAFT_403414 [Aspergillus japonicus CBS 114.51]|uniref:Uncharacterized protein n=2 Tax=Aspergillus TaxID=5052 RepID=A0A2V5HW56_ASPV1|nr:hypothetical protein BO86DRAFT_403414 [Aspergillus japonicus CBS 114.51]PYI16107.1 hypothetical protein BO99DRAFT_445624 [Aspergillus violaceofuscus CBS 115571]RAH77784.1 hypothetical protein BO86DRAFT_403414 [Aspergillus japonicus CBS 114.51]
MSEPKNEFCLAVPAVPAWLEAVDEHSLDVYAHLGFRVVEEIQVGVGEFNPRGEFEASGTGIPLYAMMSE